MEENTVSRYEKVEMEVDVVDYGRHEDWVNKVTVWIIASGLSSQAFISTDVPFLEKDDPIVCSLLYEARDKYKHDEFSLVFMGKVHGIVNVKFKKEETESTS